MLEFIHKYPVELFAGYWILSLFVSALPPLPAGTGYWGTTMYAFLHLAMASAKPMMNKLGMTDLPEPSSKVTKTKIEVTEVDNKQE